MWAAGSGQRAAGSRQAWVMVVWWHLALAGHPLGTAAGTRLGPVKGGHIKQLHVTAVPDRGHFVAPKPCSRAAGGEARGRSSGVQKMFGKFPNCLILACSPPK